MSSGPSSPCGISSNGGDAAEFLVAMGVQFLDFAALGLRAGLARSPGLAHVQSVGAVLITGNRRGGADSLNRAIRDHSDAASLPVITIGDSDAGDA